MEDNNIILDTYPAYCNDLYCIYQQSGRCIFDPAKSCHGKLLKSSEYKNQPTNVTPRKVRMSVKRAERTVYYKLIDKDDSVIELYGEPMTEASKIAITKTDKTKIEKAIFVSANDQGITFYDITDGQSNLETLLYYDIDELEVLKQ